MRETMSKIKTTERSQKTASKNGMDSISAMFKRQNESVKQCNHNCRLPQASNGRPVILIESSTDSDSADESISRPSAAVATMGGDTDSVISSITASKPLDTVKHDPENVGQCASSLNVMRSSLSLKRKCSETDGRGRGSKRLTLTNSRTPTLAAAANKSATASCKNAKKAVKKLVEIKKDVLDSSTCRDDFIHEDKANLEDEEIKRMEYREPYYKKNFDTILNAITEDTSVSDLFNNTDHAFVNSYLAISEQAKQLYVRFFGRKFKWIPSSKIKYPEIGDNLMPYLNELTDSQLIYDENSLTALNDVLEILSAGDIKTLAKTYHVASTITQKKQIIEELLKLCQRNTVSSMFGSKGGVAAAMIKKSRAMVHGAYKLQQEPRSVFIRVMMLFSLVNTTGDEDSGNGGQGQLFQMLMVNMGKVVYPSFELTKKRHVFKTRDDVIRFEQALQLESDLLHAIEKGNWKRAYDIYCAVSKELDKMKNEKEIATWNKNLPDFLRPFTAISVLYRLMSQGIDILQRRKEYDSAIALIKRLLDQEIYLCTHRGYWWERLALNLDVHLKKPLQALEAVASGLKDQHVIGGHRLGLFQRAESICDRPKLKLKYRISEFHHNPIREIPKVYLDGRILHQGMTAQGPRFLTESSYTNGNSQEMTVCGVEEFVMEHYKNNGYPSGLHAEGSIVTGLFGLFFWDILFLPIPDVFHSVYQAQPLDLYTTNSFYTARKDDIDSRLEEIEKSTFDSLSKMMEETWDKEYGKLCVGMNWERWNSVEDAKGLVQCMGGKALSGVLGRYARCPRHTRSGFPDLTLWNVSTGDWKICEVKGPGDKLSHKQILWLDYLLELGVDAEVCHVKAVAAKKLRPST